MMSSKLAGHFCLSGLLLLQAATAQKVKEAALPSALSGQSEKILDKLASLSALPKPDWRYHAGDLSHGESSSLDDSSWQPAAPTLPADALWLRATIEMPKSLNGYDAKGNLLRLSLLRSPTWPDPDADQGHQHFSYALYPHSGTWKQALTVRQGYDFNYHLTAMQVSPHSGRLPGSFSFLKATPENVVVTAMKKTEDGDGLLVRFYEWSGKAADVTLTLPPGIVSASLANLMEKPEGSPLPVSDERKVTVPVTPFHIQTVIVRYPAPQQNFLAGISKR
jgi:Glycosyl hydrolases family 38 C-terminal beta sandwich domain